MSLLELYTVKISKILSQFTNGITSINIEGTSYFNLISNINNLFPDLDRYTKESKFSKANDFWILCNGKILPPEHFFLQPRKNSEIVLVPVIKGSGEDALGIGIGVALIVASVVLLQPEIGIGIGASMFGSGGLGAVFGAVGVINTIAGVGLSLGISMALGGILHAVSPKPAQKDKDSPFTDNVVRNDNSAFEGLRNTSDTNTSIPLVYGQHRVAGHFIGGKIKTINHDKDTIISVATYI